MTIYRPSWCVSLTLRFDEALLVQTTPPADEFGAALAADPRTDPATATSPAGRAGLQTPAQAGIEPLVTQKGRDSLLANIRPMTCSVESPTTRQAGKFKLSVAYSDFPIDPRLVRAASVEIYLGSVSDDDFARGIVGSPATLPRTSQIPSLRGGQANAEDLVLVGIVDTFHVEHGEKTSRVDLEGRDLRGYFLDGKPAPALLAKLDLRKPIATGSQRPPAAMAGPVGGIGVVEQILSLCPFGQHVHTMVDPDEWPDGVVPSPGTADGATRVTLGAKGGGAAPGGSGGQQAGQQGGSASSRPSAWDLITQYCFLVGAIPYFEGWVLRVRPARSIFDLRQAGLDAEATARRAIAGAMGASDLPELPTPFKGGQPRDVGEAAPLRIRRLVYGRDIKSLSFERKTTGTKTPVIEVVGIDDTKRGAQKLIVVQWPPKPEEEARKTKVSPSGEVAQTDVVRLPIHGIRSKERLLQIARDLYEEIGRQEMGGKAETADLSSFGGGPDDPDLCRLRTGDAVEFVVDVRALSSRSPLVAPLVDSERRSFDEEVQAVMAVLESDDQNLARALVASGRSAVVTELRTFKVACVRYDLTAGGKTAIAFDFQNYVIVRQQVGEAAVRRDRGVVIGTTPAKPHRKGADVKQPQPQPPRPSVSQPTAAEVGQVFKLKPLTVNQVEQMMRNQQVGTRR